MEIVKVVVDCFYEYRDVLQLQIYDLSYVESKISRGISEGYDSSEDRKLLKLIKIWNLREYNLDQIKSYYVRVIVYVIWIFFFIFVEIV